MADNVPITAGTGTDIATDDVGSVHFQQIKVVNGTLGSTTALIVGSGGSAQVDPRPDVLRVAATPTISAAGIYAAVDCVGAGMTFANAVRVSGGSCVIEEVVVVDKDQERALLDIVFFDRAITATTDNVPFDPTDTELTQVVAVAQLVSTIQYLNFADNAVGVVRMGDVVTLTGTDLFAQIVARSTPTYTATSDITVIVSLTRL